MRLDILIIFGVLHECTAAEKQLNWQRWLQVINWRAFEHQKRYMFFCLYLGMGRKLNSLFIIHISKNMNHEGLFKMKIFKLMTLYYFSFFVIFAAFQRLKFSNYFISWSKCGNHTLWTKCRNLCRVRSRQNLSFWFRSTGFSAIINNWFIAII